MNLLSSSRIEYWLVHQPRVLYTMKLGQHKLTPARNFIFRNPARNCTVVIAYCVNNLQCIGYFLLNNKKKRDELTSKNGSTENRTKVICFIGVY